MGAFLFLGCLALSSRVGMIVHELSHALVAWLVRIPVHAIQFGHGRLWWRKRIGTIEWRIRGTLSGGQVEARRARGRHARLRDALMTAAGPVVDLAMAIACTVASNQAFADFLHGGPDGSLNWVRATAGVTVGLWCSFVYSVTRRSAEIDGKAQLTDVGIIWELWKQPPEHYRYLEVLLRVMDAFKNRGGPDDDESEPDWSLLAGDPLFGELEEATLDLIRIHPAGHPERLRYLDMLCTRALFSGDRAALKRCLPWSGELYDAGREVWTIVGTRGSVLLITGNVAEGIALLELVLANDPTPGDRAIATCCLAWAAHQRGDVDARERWWQESLRLNEGKPVIPWMAREIAAPLPA